MGSGVAGRVGGGVRAVGRWAGGGLLAAWRGLALTCLAVADALVASLLPLLAVSAAALRPLFASLLPAVPFILYGSRHLARLTRRLATDWCGTDIPDPYGPAPRGLWRRLWWVTADAATWRDLLWLHVNAAVGLLLTLPASVLIGGGVFTIGYNIHAVEYSSTVLPHVGGLVAGDVAAVAAVALGLWAAPWLLKAYGGFAHSMLAPTSRARLAQRVTDLTAVRSDLLDTREAEIRRIERDLHDGAQARLVAMGMTLSTAGEVIEHDLVTARALLAEARDNSAKALAELRDLVRGIHPPVLADRGLADAVRALALDSPLDTHVIAELPGRPPAPVESAAYFAVCELLTNAAKHAGAAQVWIDIRHEGGALRLAVSDDGTGGADAAKGSGLRGVERRLCAFDGTFAISSPPGGPTVMSVEVPCALSSPKTSSC